MAKSGDAIQAGKAGPVLLRREMAVFLPAIGLAGLWFGLDAMALLTATAVGVGWMSRPSPIPAELPQGDQRDPVTDLPLRARANELMSALMREAHDTGRGTACLVLGLDEPEGLIHQINAREFDEVLRRTSERLRGALRETDRLARIGETRFAILLKPTQRTDLESLIQLSVRLQAAAEAPLSIAARTVAVSVHLGFCLMHRSPGLSGDALIGAAETAADAAKRHAPSAIRAYSREISKAAQTRETLSSDLSAALENGQIVAFFEPQLCTDTGRISGMQAVARWLHRDRGIVSEADIMEAADREGLRQRLAEVMLYQSFNALREWDRRGENMGPISLSVSCEIMADPTLSERLKWEFDRFDLTPQRIRLVMQQSVVAKIEEEIIAHNLRACAALGCEIELVGFGDGPTSINAIRRIPARRLRIHQSFVRHVDRDQEQQRFAAAIISLAEGLGVQTIAEGVGSIAEHAMLAQLGCDHVQGKAIGLSMPLEETFDWAFRHRAKLRALPKIGRQGSA